MDDSTATPSHPSDTALVIFDCDGVLVDSEPITNRVLAQMINELGIPMTMRDMHETFLGRSMAFCCDLIAEMLGLPLPIRFPEQYRLRTTAAWMAELKAIRGIETVLDALDARNIPFVWPRAAATMRCARRGPDRSSSAFRQQAFKRDRSARSQTGSRRLPIRRQSICDRPFEVLRCRGLTYWRPGGSGGRNVRVRILWAHTSRSLNRGRCAFHRRRHAGPSKVMVWQYTVLGRQTAICARCRQRRRSHRGR